MNNVVFVVETDKNCSKKDQDVIQINAVFQEGIMHQDKMDKKRKNYLNMVLN